MLVSSPASKGQFMANQTQAPPPPETIEVESQIVACDGGDGALGHPRVYLNLRDGEAECGYCDRRFILRPGAKSHGH
jgi:uncharacterized Zn-finger protein